MNVDEVLAVAREHGWEVRDDRARGVIYMRRGREYAHLGTGGTIRVGEVLSAYAGVRGRAGAFWVSRRGDRGRQLADRLARPREARDA